jgi:hypothetical protein
MTRTVRLAAPTLAVFLAAPVAAQLALATPESADETPPATIVLDAAGSFSWLEFSAGFVASIAAHELAHLGTSLIVGGDPSVGFRNGRPVVYSGIDLDAHPHRQFAFAASGMGMQLLINEVVLDWPRGPGRAGEFERGLLAGGIGTVLFYFTIGRTSSVSDVRQMADNSGLSTWALTAIFGGVAATDVLRIALDQRYAHFFASPGPEGLRFGLTLTH